MASNIKINRSLCNSCGTCTTLAPGIFELDKNYICLVKKNPKINKEELNIAVEACPSNAIEVTDKNS